MELKEFVKESIKQISEALIECNVELKDKGVVINPKSVQVNTDSSQAYGRISTEIRHQSKVVQKIEFDVAVSTSKDQAANAGAKISVMSLSLGAEGDVNYGNKSESRLKFSVPIIYSEGDSEPVE
ncbi:MAG: hypothetical protein ABNH21_13065 [Glaciecola sp.]|jgi:hypothetical protein